MDHFAGYSPSATHPTILHPLLPSCHLYSSFLLGLTNGGPQPKMGCYFSTVSLQCLKTAMSLHSVGFCQVALPPWSQPSLHPTICYSCPFGLGTVMAPLCCWSWILDHSLFVPVTLPTGAAIVPSLNSLPWSPQRSILIRAKIPMQPLCKINIEVLASWLRTVSKHKRPTSIKKTCMNTANLHQAFCFGKQHI